MILFGWRKNKVVAIRVINVKKEFKNQIVLNNISLDFDFGKIYGITGFNGSGKTVFLKCLCGLLSVDEGEIYIRGKKLKKDMDMISDAGIIIEAPAFLKAYNGRKNLEFLYSIKNPKNPDHITNIMQRVGLDPFSKKKVEKYSMGMKQRLAIAQAIMEDQDILILDEPMSGLDRKGIEDMRELFIELRNAGKLLIMASHSKIDIDKLCNEVLEIEDGNIQKLC